MGDFLHMGGYAFYVWASYLLGLVVVVVNLWQPRRAEREVWRQLKRRRRNEERMNESETP
ncbi:heme exporter protein CcmD [Sulfurivermis fontis]|uniref:heme exporter protein CcmD n=1 Tax=Sulfurivermis fontis TaxID=1972068 RepID=UPI000FD70D40|nr:heme exporter protein CcmD [Sulfurivermis fontis]